MTTNVVPAELRELDSSFDKEINESNWVKVQFNPETLKVAFANAIQQVVGGGDQGGGASQQFVGAGSTKLAVQLWFDVSSDATSEENDVRNLTRKVAYFITPQPTAKDPKRFLPPIVRFLWGSFQFDGIAESMEESLEFFSPEGRPLRASISLAIAQQRIQFVIRDPLAAALADAAAIGTRPLTQPPPATSVQQLHSQNGGVGDWQPVARANGVDNPRFPSPDRALDLNRRN